MIKLNHLFCAAALAFSATASASPMLSGFSQTILAEADDDSIAVGLGGFMNLKLNGAVYNALYVNTNGNVSFGGEMDEFSPRAFNDSFYGTPFLAPLFADADTRRASNGEAVGSHGTVGYGSTQFGNRNAFAVTWSNVGYYDKKNDKQNTFQLVLVDRTDTGAGNFDFYYNYGSVQWDVRGGANNGRAGYVMTGTAADFEFAGSGAGGMLVDSGNNALAKGSNIGVAGRYGFTVRDGLVAQDMPENKQVPLPGSAGLLGIGALALGLVRRRKA